MHRGPRARGGRCNARVMLSTRIALIFDRHNTALRAAQNALHVRRELSEITGRIGIDAAAISREDCVGMGGREGGICARRHSGHC